MTTITDGQTVTLAASKPGATVAVDCSNGAVVRIDWTAPGGISGSRTVRAVAESDIPSAGSLPDGAMFVLTCLRGTAEYTEPDANRSSVSGSIVGLVASSAVPIVLTGTTSATVLATIPVPANTMGANGTLRITVRRSMTNNANGKRLQIRWGGAATDCYNANLTSVAGETCQCYIASRGATGSQLLSQGGTGVSYGTMPGFNSASEDTTAVQNIQILGTLANAGDTMTIEQYIVEILK